MAMVGSFVKGRNVVPPVARGQPAVPGEGGRLPGPEPCRITKIGKLICRCARSRTPRASGPNDQQSCSCRRRRAMMKTGDGDEHQAADAWRQLAACSVRRLQILAWGKERSSRSPAPSRRAPKWSHRWPRRLAAGAAGFGRRRRGRPSTWPGDQRLGRSVNRDQPGNLRVR